MKRRDLRVALTAGAIGLEIVAVIVAFNTSTDQLPFANVPY